jgi:hypothetical protein
MTNRNLEGTSGVSTIPVATRGGLFADQSVRNAAAAAATRLHETPSQNGSLPFFRVGCCIASCLCICLATPSSFPLLLLRRASSMLDNSSLGPNGLVT